MTTNRNRIHVDALESRRLLAATDFGFSGAPTLIAIADQDTFGDATPRSISYYDVSAIDQAISLRNDADPSNDVDLFDKTPLFTIFTGFEVTGDVGGGPENFEELNAFDVNPVNGDTYVLAFDSTDGGAVTNPADPSDPANFDEVGDGLGDYDLYRLNVGLVYNDFVTNGRNAGTLYLPQIAPDGFDYYQAYGNDPTPDVSGGDVNGDVTDGDLGIPAFRSNTDADTTNDVVILPFASEKIGEIARIQGDDGANEPPFFNNQEISFVDADTLVLMENVDGDGGELDFQIRTIERLATVAGGAPGISAGPSGDADDFVGGRNPLAAFGGDDYVDLDTPLTSESWVVNALTGVYPDGFVDGTTDGQPDQDPAGAFVRLDGTGQSDVDGMRYVPFDSAPNSSPVGVPGGVWVTDRDGGTGDEFAFYEIDFAADVAVLRELQVGAGAPFPTDFNLDDDPAAGDNMGSVGFFDVDEEGNLRIVESNFMGSTNPDTTNSQIITREVLNYTAGDTDASQIEEVSVGGFAASGPLANTVTDDTPGFPDLVDDRFGVFERGEDYLYLIDSDGPADDDVYVFDADPESATFGQVVYEELDAVNHFLRNGNRIRALTLGDYDAQDGVVGPADVDALYDAVAAGLPAAAQEALDLNGDDVLSGLGSSATQAGTDSAFFIRGVIGTQFGDLNLNGVVNTQDLLATLQNFGQSGAAVSLASGDTNGDGVVNTQDLLTVLQNFGFVA